MSSMPGDVYGGSGWAQQLADLLAQAAGANISLADLLGWYNEGYEAPRPAPTEQQALEAIWANRPDIRAAYADWWRDREFTPAEAVRNWLSISPEANGQSAVEFALAQGWVQPATEGNEGTKVPTLAREQFNAQTEYQNKMLEYQQAALEQAERLHMSDQEYQKMLQDADHLFRRELHDDTMAFEREKQAFMEKYQLDTLEWNKFVDTKNIELETRRLEQSGRLTDAQIQDMHDRLALDRYSTDLDAQLKREAMQIERERDASNAEIARQGLGLDYLDTLSRLRGPADYFQYQNVKRAAQNTALPAWAQALVSGQTLSPFQGAGQMQAATPQTLLSGGQGSWLDQLAAAAGYGAQPSSDVTPPPMLQPQQQQQGWEQQMYQQMQNLVANPQSVRIDQWNSMMPSEQQMLGSMVEYLGGDMNDWLAQMQKAAPTGGKVGSTSYWSGW